jgi:hypothetical protein
MRDFPSPAWAGVRRTGSGPGCHGQEQASTTLDVTRVLRTLPGPCARRLADFRWLSALQSWMENKRGFPAGAPDLVFH